MIIEIQGMGAEKILQEITQDQNEYWSAKDSKELLNHLIRSESDEGGIPDKFRLPRILNSETGVHKYGGYIDEAQLIVTSRDGRLIFKMGLEELIEDELGADVPQFDWVNTSNFVKYYVLWTSEESRVSTFIDIDDDGHFDVYSLKIALHEFDGGGLVELVSYKGVPSQNGDASMGSVSVALITASD